MIDLATARETFDSSTDGTVGIEEEVMLLDEITWALAHRIDSVLPRLPHARDNHFTAETHGSALEIQTGVLMVFALRMVKL